MRNINKVVQAATDTRRNRGNRRSYIVFSAIEWVIPKLKHRNPSET